MYMKVSTKLWLTFVGILSVSLLSLYLLLHNSLKQGFLDYTSQQSVQRLEIFRSALSHIYQSEKSFSSIQNDPERWINLKEIIFAETDSLFASTVNEPPASANSPKAYYRGFVSSISLHDEDKNLLVGVIKPEKTLEWIPIMQRGTIIGFISFVKPTVVSRSQDRKFLRHQFKIFTIISFLVLGIATLFSVFFAKRISQPITELAKNVKRLTEGDYSQTMYIKNRDEVGQLCTSFNQLSETLAANEKSRADWIADISHEMRTPLSVLKVQVEAMQDGLRPADQKNLALAHDKILGLSTLIDDLFELTLSDLGTLTYQKEKLAINPLLKQCVESHLIQASAVGLTLRDNLLDCETSFMIGDKQRLNQLFCNILENSLRYTNTGGTIAITLATGANAILIKIEDSAPGVAVAQHHKIFERLYRVEGSRSRSTGGSGLGLAICKNIVLAHQGSILASDSPLGGLRVDVEFPTA